MPSVTEAAGGGERPPDVLLEVDGVVAGYGGGDVLRGVDFIVPQGSITCIVGPTEQASQPFWRRSWEC